ncbi:MAG TPA: radical SAM protein [Spirochaetia bacterium]|nr:radical SAM protein [Spirochaetia bacterium]
MHTSVSPPLGRAGSRGANPRPVRITLCITLRCNLACSYCYVEKRPERMSEETARKAVAFAFEHTPPDRPLEFGFFGGEPLLEIGLLEEITHMAERHPRYDPMRVTFSVTTNGTIFSDRIAAFLRRHGVKTCISCDGPPEIQNLHRRGAAGEPTAALVEETTREALRALPRVLVNAVYGPATLDALPRTVEYLSGLGLRQIHLNADYSADWACIDPSEIISTYRRTAQRYLDWYRAGIPHYINLIDEKIAVALRGGYLAQERCQMGTGELAITPDGGIYPCERLIGTRNNGPHRIGCLEHGIDPFRMDCRRRADGDRNRECETCPVRDYCMNWCGCSNAFMTGFYNRVGSFLCASEKAAIQVAIETLRTMEAVLGPVFLHHYAGQPSFNSMSAGG